MTTRQYSLLLILNGWEWVPATDLREHYNRSHFWPVSPRELQRLMGYLIDDALVTYRGTGDAREYQLTKIGLSHLYP